MINIEELRKGTLEDLKAACQADLDAFQAEVVNKLMTVEECEQKELEVVRECEEFDEYMKDATYAIPNLAQFDGVTYTPEQIYEFIRTFLNKQELEFSYCLGMYELSKFYEQKPSGRMLFGVLDSTLHTLNTFRFKGPEQWKMIMAIHNFFLPMHNEYLKDNTLKIYFASKHNMVVDRAALCGGKKDNAEPVQNN